MDGQTLRQYEHSEGPYVRSYLRRVTHQPRRVRDRPLLYDYTKLCLSLLRIYKALPFSPPPRDAPAPPGT